MEGVGFCMIFLLTTAVSVGLHTVVEYMMDNDSTGTGVSSEIDHLYLGPFVACKTDSYRELTHFP